MSKPLPNEAETYIMKIRDRSSQHGTQLQKLKDARADELERVTNEIQIEQAKKTLADIKGGMQRGQSLASMIFADKTPEQIKELLAKLNPADLAKLEQIAQATDTNPVSVAMRSPPSASRDDVLLKYILEQNSPERLLVMIKAIKELAPAPAPAVQIQQPSASGRMSETLELVKIISELNRPFYESLGKKDKELYDAKLEAIKAGMPGSLEEQIKYVKEMAPVLGLAGQGSTTELDLKLEEMRQNQDLDNRRLDWEMKKAEMEMESDNQKWEQITKILQGPIGQAIQGIGNAGADRVRGKGGAPNPSGKSPQAVQTQCPQCHEVIFVDQNSDTAICGHCGATLQKQGASVPPEVTPAPPTHVDAPAPATEPAQPEDEEEEETDGRVEPESEQPEK